jgi:PTS system fructose-specific IIA component
MLVDKSLIILELDAKSKEEAISKLAHIAERAGKVTSSDEYMKSVLQREKSCTTGIGNGIAIPHGKSKAVKEAMIAFAKCRDGIEWDSLDGGQVNIIFLLGVPEQNVDNMHLKILSQLSRKLMNEDFVALLKSAKSEDEVFAALSDIKVS